LVNGVKKARAVTAARAGQAWLFFRSYEAVTPA
jgi:hypothetical protein